MTKPQLHCLCGKAASGKSTLAGQLSTAPDTLLLSEDIWLDNLFGDQMTTLADYIRCADRLQAAIAPHVVQLLRAGLSVVLDFQANTVTRRAWMRDLAAQADASCLLHVLEAPDTLCLSRLAQRNQSGTHPFTLTEAQFAQLSRHFQPPTAAEGFEIRRHG